MRREERRCANPRCGKLLRRPPWRFRGVRQPTCGIVCRVLVARGQARSRRPIVRNGRPYVRSPGHLLADARGYVLQAVLVAESALGRSLTLDERVTVLDRNPFNLDPANLVLESPRERRQLRAP